MKRFQVNCYSRKQLITFFYDVLKRDLHFEETKKTINQKLYSRPIRKVLSKLEKIKGGVESGPLLENIFEIEEIFDQGKKIEETYIQLLHEKNVFLHILELTYGSKDIEKFIEDHLKTGKVYCKKHKVFTTEQISNCKYQYLTPLQYENLIDKIKKTYEKYLQLTELMEKGKNLIRYMEVVQEKWVALQKATFRKRNYYLTTFWIEEEVVSELILSPQVTPAPIGEIQVYKMPKAEFTMENIAFNVKGGRSVVRSFDLLFTTLYFTFSFAFLNGDIGFAIIIGILPIYFPENKMLLYRLTLISFTGGVAFNNFLGEHPLPITILHKDLSFKAFLCIHIFQIGLDLFRIIYLFARYKQPLKISAFTAFNLTVLGYLLGIKTLYYYICIFLPFLAISIHNGPIALLKSPSELVERLTLTRSLIYMVVKAKILHIIVRMLFGLDKTMSQLVNDPSIYLGFQFIVKFVLLSPVLALFVGWGLFTCLMLTQRSYVEIMSAPYIEKNSVVHFPNKLNTPPHFFTYKKTYTYGY